jgi:DNA repair photolyase
MEMDAWLKADVDGEETRERYQYFMRPEPRENMGPILEEDDALTGQRLRYRMVKVGMVRNDPNARELKAYLDPLPHIRIDKAKDLQGWYQAKDVPGIPALEQEGGRPRPCFTDALLTEPYGGYCTVGCSFCYVNSGFRGYRGSGLISVPVDYGDQVRRQLGKLRTSAAGYFSSFTDPFLPLEELYHNSQRGAEAFVELGLPIFFLSRLRYPDWAVELLQRSPYSYAQKSINTSVPEDWKKLSPAALPLLEHMDDIRRLRAAGIYVSIQCNPVLPGITTHDHILRLFEMLAEAGANHVIVKFAEAGYSWAPTMIERQRKRFGVDRARAFELLFTQNIGGQRTIDEDYRMDGHRLYQRKATEVGMTYATCYEFRYARDAEGKVLNKRGISVGPEFITGDQCHGHRVPMFTRQELDQPFREVAECPPTGCLLCTDKNEGKPRCGSELFGSAKALRLPDLKKAVR